MSFLALLPTRSLRGLSLGLGGLMRPGIHSSEQNTDLCFRPGPSPSPFEFGQSDRYWNLPGEDQPQILTRHQGNEVAYCEKSMTLWRKEMNNCKRDIFISDIKRDNWGGVISSCVKMTNQGNESKFWLDYKCVPQKGHWWISPPLLFMASSSPTLHLQT